MSVTDDERREVARELRELPIDMYEVLKSWGFEGIDTCCSDQTDYYLIHQAVFGCVPADHMHPCDYEELHMRLADLIEPEPERTCWNKVVRNNKEFPPEYRTDNFICSACGALFFADSEYINHPIDWAYCPDCGAKVVDE